MKLFRYYRNAVIYPSLFIVFFCVIHSIIANYEGNGQMDKSIFAMSIITSIIFSILMSGLSLTIFLNKIKRLNKYLIWNILSWLLLPITYITIIFIRDIRLRIYYDFGFGKDFLYLLTVTIPFVIGLCWTLIKYRQNITTADTA